MILSVIWLPIKSLVASAGFWITLFEAVLTASKADILEHDQEVSDYSYH